MVLDGFKKFCVFKFGDFVLFEWLSQGLLNQYGCFFNEIVLLFEQFLIFMACEWKFFKGAYQKLRNHQISFLNTDALPFLPIPILILIFITIVNILFHFAPILLQFINLYFDNMIQLFFTFGYKLFEYWHKFV